MSAAPRNEVEAGFAAQRDAADPAVSAWVTANAGAGKTQVLVNRVIRILLGGTKPGRILCLTFTKAAAAEMTKRLFERLGEWTTMPDRDLKDKLSELLGREAGETELASSRRLFAEALDTPGRLKIMTIHAFCESLLGRFPLEAGLSPHFTVMDERTTAELLDAARERMLADAQREDGAAKSLADALDCVVGLTDEAGFAGVMRELSRVRGKLRRMIQRHRGLDGLIRATRRALGLGAGEARDSILAAAAADPAFDGEGLSRACAALDQGSKSDRERAQIIRDWLEGGGDRAAMFEGPYRRVFLTGEGKCKVEKNIITKQAQDKDAGARDILLAEQARVAAVDARLKSAFVAESTAALLRLGEALLESYESEKRRRALLDYDDLIFRTRDLLAQDGGVSWVLYKLDGGIDHILVDEAQDTSLEQWQVIAALAEEFFAGEGGYAAAAASAGPRTVFAVGDEKQSIFSFQGADPREFEAMRAHFAEKVAQAEEVWRPVDLALSFRAAPVLLEAVDRVFAREDARDGLTAGGREVLHKAYRSGQSGRVELWPTLSPKERKEFSPWDAPLDQLSADSPQARLAERIAGCIAGWLEKGEMLESHGRPIRPGDILILVRRRTAFVDEMVRRLKQKDVPVAGTDRMVLSEQIAVMDLTALGHFLLMPEDDLNLAVVLKSPLFGFDEEALFDLAHGRRESLWARLRRRRDENDLFGRAEGELTGLLERADYTAPFEFFAGLLGPGGGRKRLISRLGPDANDPIDEFLTRAFDYERTHAPSMQGFLHWLGEGGTEIKRDLERARDEVRVMTVHGAKGLEANIVFLPDTCGVPDPRLDEKLLWPESAGMGGGGEPVMLWPVRKANEAALCETVRLRARARREREFRRLLYVAMTRARDRLYVCGWETSRGREDGCWYDLIAAAFDDRAQEVPLPSGGTGRRLHEPQTAPPDGGKEADEEAAPTGDLPAWAGQKAPPEAAQITPLAPSRQAGEEPPVYSPLALRGEDSRFKRGRIIHRLLQSLPGLPREERESACRRYLSRAVHGLGAGEQAEITAETLAVLDTPDFAPLFGPGSMAEADISGRVGGPKGEWTVSGRIDRLRITGDAVLVVDYKSDRRPPDRAEDAPLPYLRQMAAYRALLMRIYPGKTVRCALLWTDGPVLMPLDGALLQAHAS